MASRDNWKIIGEFDLSDHGLPTAKGYLVHQIFNGGNSGERYPKNRECLRIISSDLTRQAVDYGYVYFMLYKNASGIPVSEYIGSKVEEKYRNKGLGDLLMSAYLYYSYDKGFKLVESTTRQRKLDILSLMDKYGFRVKTLGLYENGERTTLCGNNMVVDIYKKNEGGVYYSFKTEKAEKIYRRDNFKIADGYNYLPPLEYIQYLTDADSYTKIGWVVPNEEYRQTENSLSIVDECLNKSGFSR